MDTRISTPRIILIAGHWLGSWAWDEVMKNISDTGAHAIALTLPGLDPSDDLRLERTLEDQVHAIHDALNADEVTKDSGAVVVAHSGANLPVSVVLDRFPELVSRVVWVDSGPAAHGTDFAQGLPDSVTEFPLPAFEDLAQQASLDGLTDDLLTRFRDSAVSQPTSVLRTPLSLQNPARYNVPTTLLCSSMPSAMAVELARAGNPMFAEVASLTNLELVDLPTGHWPMMSRPADLAQAILAEALR